MIKYRIGDKVKVISNKPEHREFKGNTYKVGGIACQKDLYGLNPDVEDWEDRDTSDELYTLSKVSFKENELQMIKGDP